MLKLIMLTLIRSIRFLVFSVFLFLLNSCLEYNKKIPEAKKGILELSEFDFEKADFIPLSGEYEFYWQELLFPDYFETNRQFTPEFFYLPGIWNNKLYKGKKLKGSGYATFRLKFILDENTTSFAIYIKNFATSYRLYINNVLLATNGVVSTSESEYKPHFFPNLISLENLKPTNYLIIHVANFSYYQGGPWNNILIGKKEKLNDMLNKKTFFATVVLMSLIITGIFHLSIYFLRKKEKLFLYFVIFCISASICFFINGQSEFRKFLINIDWHLLEKLMFVLLYIPVFPPIIEKLFTELINKKFHTIYVAFQFLLIGFVLLTPTYIFTHTITLFHISVITLSLYSIYIITKAVRAKYENSIFLLLNIVIFFAFILIDIILINQFPHINFSLSYIGIISFTFSLHYIIIAKFIKSFDTIEKISEEFNLEKPIINLNQKTIFLTIENELKKVKENEERLNKILQNIPLVIIEADKDLNVIFLNQTAMEMFNVKTHNNLKLSNFLNEKEISKLNKALREKNPSNFLLLNFKNEDGEHFALMSKLVFSYKEKEIASIKVTGMNIQEIIRKSTHPEEILFKNYHFSPREKEVLILLLQGYRTKDIANKLFIAESTVKEHLGSIYAELNVKSKYELFEKLKEYKQTNIGYESFLSYILNYLTNE